MRSLNTVPYKDEGAQYKTFDHKHLARECLASFIHIFLKTRILCANSDQALANSNQMLNSVKSASAGSAFANTLRAHVHCTLCERSRNFYKVYSIE